MVDTLLLSVRSTWVVGIDHERDGASTSIDADLVADGGMASFFLAVIEAFACEAVEF